MQELSTSLETALRQAGGELRLRHRVERLQATGAGWHVQGVGPKGQSFSLEAADVVCSLPPQGLPGLLGDQMPAGLQQRVESLGDPSGALVLYGAVEGNAARRLPSPLAIGLATAGSLFVSISQEGDGRAPAGQATVIASVFTPARGWFELDPKAYQTAKAEAQEGLRLVLSNYWVCKSHWLHRAGHTARLCPLDQPPLWIRWRYRPSTGSLWPLWPGEPQPLAGLWLCGDAIYPGEGTAGVSLSAEMAVRQLLAQRKLGRAA